PSSRAHTILFCTPCSRSAVLSLRQSKTLDWTRRAPTQRHPDDPHTRQGRLKIACKPQNHRTGQAPKHQPTGQAADPSSTHKPAAPHFRAATTARQRHDGAATPCQGSAEDAALDLAPVVLESVVEVGGR